MIVKNKHAKLQNQMQNEIKIVQAKKSQKSSHIYIFYEVIKQKVLFLKPLFFYSKFVKTKT